MEYKNPLWFSIYRVEEGARAAAPLKKRDVWWCRKCRHSWRRFFAMRPTRWEVYATTGTVRPETMCPPCRRRLKALDSRETPAEVGGRVVGVDA